MFIDAYTQNHYSIADWLPPRILLYAIQAYAGPSPVTTGNASFFDDSRLSINTSAADFPWYTFSEVAILSESQNSDRVIALCV